MKVIGAAVLAGLVVYTVPLLIFREQVSPITVMVAALFVGVLEYRKLNREPAIPDAVWIGIAVAALVLYTGVLVAGAVPNSPGDWFAMVAVFALPILVLVQIFAGRRSV
jgi:hypothetical protein